MAETKEVQRVEPVEPMEKNLAESVLKKIKLFEETGTLNLPKDYSPGNALRVAWLILQDSKDQAKRPVLEVCTKESIANALLKMILQGLNPVKHQCSFIAYGNQLACQREYQGTIAIARRDAGVVKIIGNVIYKDDSFKFAIDTKTGKRTVTEHIQTLESMGGEIIGAYAIKEYENGTQEAEIMTWKQITAAWNQGATKGQSPAHKNFPDQMAIKTVINRCLKTDVNASDDGAVMDDVSPNGDDVKMAHVKQTIEDRGNRNSIGFEEAEQVPEKKMPSHYATPERENVPTESVNANAGPGF